jgi:hypothetical protein
MIEKAPIANMFDKFCQLTGTRVRVLQTAIRKKEKTIDTEIELRTGTQRTHFFVEQKNEIRDGMLPDIIRQMHPKKNWLLACQYIPGPAKETLREMGVNYIEAAGNCFIRAEGLFFFVNDQAMTAYRLVREGKIWNPAGLKFLFAILQWPALLNLPQRRLAITADVALGNIGPFMDELEENGFLARGKKDKKK